MNSWRYNLLLHLLLPFVYLRLLWRGRTVPTYKQNIEQRFGGHKNLPQHGIMIHAVSLGETLDIVNFWQIASETVMMVLDVNDFVRIGSVRSISLYIPHAF